jgi:gliding motility-associated lipoprotein GldD
LKAGEFSGLKSLSLILLFLSVWATTGCKEATQPKPTGYFRIGLPEEKYEVLQTPCPYTFEINSSASWIPKNDCWGDITYPTLKSVIQITYKPISSPEDLSLVIGEAQDLAFKHTVKAEGIGEKLYVDEEKRVFGLMYQMMGNAASSTQFYVTDSNQHFLRGVLYFYSVPNADSLRTVNEFMTSEIRKLIETLEWKN